MSLIKNLYIRFKNSSYWKDIAWQVSGNGLAQAIGVGTMPIITRLYSPHDFALSNLFLQVVGFLTILMTWRYEHFVQLPKNDAESRLILRLVVFLGILGCFFTTPIAYVFRDIFAKWLNNQDMAQWLYFAPITAVIVTFAMCFQYQVQRKQNYRKSGIAEIINKSGYVASCFLGYWFFSGATGLMLATVLGASAKLLFLIAPNKKGSLNTSKLIDLKQHGEIKPSLTVIEVAKKYSKRSVSLVFSHIMLSFTTSIPVFFIAKAYGGNILGQYSLALSTLFLPTSLIGNAIGQVYYQRAASRYSEGRDFNDIWRSTMKRLTLIGLPLYAILMFISPWVYPIVFGQAWVDAGRFAAVLSISTFFSFITSPLDRACLVVNAWRYVLFWHCTRALSTGLVAWQAWLQQWGFMSFLEVLVAQMSLMYLIDYFAEWRFSKYQNGRMIQCKD